MHSDEEKYLGGIYVGYRNGKEILPEDLIRQIQEYIDGEYVYIPRKEEYRKSWGTTTDIKKILQKRNQDILKEYNNGKRVSELAGEYHLSKQGIYKILSKERVKENGPY